MSELSKYFKSEPIEIERSKIRLADYNPRKISDEALRKLKANIKKVGLLGGIVWNVQTRNLVSGHQRVTVLDQLNKYDGTPETDYLLRVEKVDFDPKEEKQQNIFMNNGAVQGEWDYDMLREMIPDIDYKDAGLTEEDLNLIGCDFLLQSEGESDLTSELDNMMAATNQQREANKELSKAERAAKIKETKKQVREDAEEKAQNMESYVMIAFDSYKAKAAFVQRFGFDEQEKFIKGEVFSNMIERVE